jgi:hypothetical protein
MAKQIDADLLHRAVHAIGSLADMLEAAGVRPAITAQYRQVADEVADHVKPPAPPKPFAGQIGFDLPSDSSPSQSTTLQDHGD